jgi:O-antigen ligase
LLIGVFEALLGITQRFVSPGWILGYYQNRFSDVSGTLINRNHFAGLMSMLTFIPFGLAHAESREGEVSRPYIYLWASAFMAVAMLCSLSRMGVIAFIITLFIVILLIRSESRRGLPGAALGLALLALVIAGAAWIGVDALIGRYSSLVDSNETVNEARPIIFRDTVRMIADHPWGVGHDNYADAFRQYQTTRLNLLFDHAHNDYLETVAEWGILPGVLFWAGVLALIVRSVRVFRASDSSRVRGILLGSIGAVVTIMIHSLADFNLQIPSNAMLFFVALGIAAAQNRTLA